MGVYEAWACYKEDPDVFIAKWLSTGTLVGILASPGDAGAFPRVD